MTATKFKNAMLTKPKHAKGLPQPPSLSPRKRQHIDFEPLPHPHQHHFPSIIQTCVSQWCRGQWTDKCWPHIYVDDNFIMQLSDGKGREPREWCEGHKHIWWWWQHAVDDEEVELSNSSPWFLKLVFDTIRATYKGVDAPIYAFFKLCPSSSLSTAVITTYFNVLHLNASTSWEEYVSSWQRQYKIYK